MIREQTVEHLIGNSDDVKSESSGSLMAITMRMVLLLLLSTKMMADWPSS
jgi:hypothetical protein